MGAILGIIPLFICLVIPSRVNESSSEIKCQVGQPVEVVTDVDIETSIPSMEEITHVVDTFAALKSNWLSLTVWSQNLGEPFVNECMYTYLNKVLCELQSGIEDIIEKDQGGHADKASAKWCTERKYTQ